MIYLFEKSFFTLWSSVIIYYLLFLLTLLNERSRLTLIDNNIVFEENYICNYIFLKYFNL